MKSLQVKGFGALSVLALLAAAVLVAGTTACGQGALERGLSGPVPATPQELMTELQTHKENIDRASDQMMKRIDAFNASRKPGEKQVQFSEIFYSDLNPEQRDVLDQLLQQEKDPSYHNLLSRIIEDKKAIQDLQEKVLRLEQQLPDKFALAHKGDTHYKLAHDFLMEQGVPEEQAKGLLNQIDLSEDLVPGFKVWYNYDKENNTFKTYVTQGEAGQTPLAVKRALKRQLIGERDSAMAKAAALEQTKTSLEKDVASLQTDVRGLEDRKGTLEVQVADLEARNGDLQTRGDRLEDDLAFRQNSLFYYAGSEGQLAQQGVLTRFLKNLKDIKGITYDDALDLRQAKSISFTPAAYGLRSIKGVEVWPEVYQEGRDYTVQVSEDGGAATIVINDPNVFRQQRVLFAIRGET
ncbi:MAG TPA: hypothetical protein VFG76_00300 [Candidatus Polarisedimenticolia bacterium]|nr:hypothetical protein [Candidatus Polarisedimenticolia bacterium]